LRIELTPVEPPARARYSSPPVYWKLVTAVLNGALRTCPVKVELVWRYEKLVVALTVKPKVPVLMNNIPSEWYNPSPLITSEVRPLAFCEMVVSHLLF
jgi:hypothetical protein